MIQMNKNILELGFCIHYVTGVEEFLESGQVWKEGVACYDYMYKITTDTDKGRELFNILAEIFRFDKVYLSAISFDRIPKSSANVTYNSFKAMFKKYSDFEKMCEVMNIAYFEKNVNIDLVLIAFKPLNMVKDVDYGWTSVEQYLKGEIGVRPNDR